MAKSLGVYLTYVLRHKPQSIGIAMDTQGWVSVHDLLEKIKYRKLVTLEMLVDEVNGDDKGRFQFNAKKTRIRCVQGHSVEHVILSLQEWTEQAHLYHGTAKKNVPSIMHGGIDRRKRKHVHLSSSSAVAYSVGQRHGEPVVFRIDALAMMTHGYKFYRAENGVILTEFVPSRYLVLLENINEKAL